MLEYYRDLAEQLANMPGGTEHLRAEFFSELTLAGPAPDDTPSSGTILEGWRLKGQGTLALVGHENGESQLIWLRQGEEEILAVFPGALQQAAREHAIPPLGLALLALAMGNEGNDRLKKMLPDLHKASKGLLLIAVCRLCG